MDKVILRLRLLLDRLSNSFDRTDNDVQQLIAITSKMLEVSEGAASEMHNGRDWNLQDRIGFTSLLETCEAFVEKNSNLIIPIGV